MSARTEPPFRADHVGSLLRPPALLDARERARRRPARRPPACARSRTTRSGRRWPGRSDIGLQAATDGEFRRTSWHMDFIYRLGGISRTEERIRVRMHNAAGRATTSPPPGWPSTGRVRLDEPIFADDFRFLADTVTTAVPKLTIPSPSMVHYRAGCAAVDRAVYPDLEEFWADLSAAYADAGPRAWPSWAAPTCSSTTPRWPTSTTRRSGPSWPPAARTRRTSTCATSARSTPRWPGGPTGMPVTTHMCRGNFRS